MYVLYDTQLNDDLHNMSVIWTLTQVADPRGGARGGSSHNLPPPPTLRAYQGSVMHIFYFILPVVRMTVSLTRV